MSHSMVVRILRKRPLSSATLAGISGMTTYAHCVEWKTEQQQQKHLQNQTQQHYSNNLLEGGLPRTYDKKALDDYWKGRPVTVVKRFFNIVQELGPRAAAYVTDFYLTNNNNTNSNTTTTKAGEYETKKKEFGSNDDQHSNLSKQRQHAIQLRQALTNLGPAFVKAGQQLSIRPDLVSPAVLKELQKLCDAVEPVPDKVAMDVLKHELQCQDLSELFDDIQLVASASLGQVYKAQLKPSCKSTSYKPLLSSSSAREEYKTVAIKIQRPDIVGCVTLDLWILSKWGVFMDGFTSIFTNQTPFHVNFLDAYCKGSYQELDYVNEAANQRRFQTELAKRKCKVVVPDVYDDFTTHRVLTSQWIDGIKLADSSPTQIQELIPVGVELFLTQLLDIGSFHADPHPGNLYVTQEGTLCLLDFGLCAEVDEQSRTAMTKAIVNLLTGNFDSLVQKDAKELGFLPRDMDTHELQPILTKVLTEGLLESGSNLHTRKRKLMDISNELNDLFFRYPFSVPPFFALVTRGLGLLEGIALTGDPNFDIFQASYPYASRRALQLLGSHYGLHKIQRSLTSSTKTTNANEGVVASVN